MNDIKNIKKIKPMFTALVTTMEKYSGEQYIAGTSMIDVNKSKQGIKEYQTVVSIGDSVRGIKVGDIVCINPSRFGVKKHQEGSLKDGIIGDNPVTEFIFDIVNLDNIPHLLLQDRDISFVVEDFE